MTPVIVSPTEQRKALDVVLKTLSADFLTLPEPLLKLFPPRPPGLARNRESLPSMTGLTFDPVASAEAAADLTVAVLFNPERASRLVEYHARNPEEPSLEGVIDATVAATRPARSIGPPIKLAQVVQNAIYIRVVEALLNLVAAPQNASGARAIVSAQLEKIKRQTTGNAPTDAYIAHRIEEFQRDPAKFIPSKPVEAPPGMPIGSEED